MLQAAALRLARNSSRRARSDVSVEGRSVFAGLFFLRIGRGD